MHDLISRQAAIGALDDNITLTGWGNSVAVRDYILRAKKRLQAISAAQPEIIRCKDCKHADEDGVCQNSIGLAIQDDDDFCSHAERREDV